MNISFEWIDATGLARSTRYAYCDQCGHPSDDLWPVLIDGAPGHICHDCIEENG